MLAKSKLLVLLIALLLIPSNISSTLAQSSGVITITGTVLPEDATNFVITEPGDGSGDCVLNWDNSTTSNAETSRIINDSGFSLTSTDLPIQIGDGGTDPGSAETTTFTNLVVGWTYIFSHTSLAGSLQSPGIWSVCTPTSTLPAPILDSEPATTTGTSNTLTWTNGGIDDAGLECQISTSLSDLDNNPTATIVDQSSWAACGSSATTYTHTFNGLTLNNTYYYHVQSRSAGFGVSPYSNVELSTQIDTGGGGGTPPPGGGGGTHPSAPDCGNNIKETGEQCDDGNLINGDGCSSTCQDEAIEQCGNGLLEGLEQCDDGNLINGDGCSSICEDEVIVDVIFEIKGKPQYRAIIDATPNLRLNANLHFFRQSSGSVDTDAITLDSYGLGTHQTEILTGTYDIGLNGDAHNTKIISGIEITDTTEVVTLDFTFVDTVELVAGDTADDNYVNAIDVAKLLGSYKVTGDNVNDLNKEDVVNAIDIAIMVWNYKEEGEYFFQNTT